MPKDQSYGAIQDVVLEVLENASGEAKENISMEDNLYSDLSMDSLSLFEMAIDLEEFYQVQMEDEVLDGIQTVGDVCRYIEAEHKKRYPQE